MSRVLGAAAVAVGTAVLATGCTHLLDGKPVSVFGDPFHVAGMPATDGPSGARSDAPQATRAAEGGDGGKEDQLAAQSVSDIEQFWQGGWGGPLTGTFTPVKHLISWDANGYNSQFCGDDTAGVVDAAFCPLDNSIGWDRGELLPQLRAEFGDMAITMVLAHEYGHSVQHQAKLIDKTTPTLVAEQQADCFAGVYMRWVAEGNSPRFTLSTGDGLNNLLAALISFRDPVLTESDPEMGADEHGSAFERISAFQFGFTDGAPACAGIDEKEITQRRGDLPAALQQNQTGEWPVSAESVKAIVEALTTLFSPTSPPQVSFDSGTASSCPDARPSPPASYCPASKTIVVDLPGLQKLGTPSQSDTNTGLLFGDNTAYSALTSRFMLAIEQDHGGLLLNNAQAALRTACLTGVATTKLSAALTVSEGNTVALTAGDLDEAVSGILTNGLVADDVNGESVPAGFSRIDAFRTGVLGDEDRCLKRYP
jgi:predicted metalloprotease